MKQNFLPLQKGKDPSKQNNKIVYRIPCNDCEKIYIGESRRKRDKRIFEHKTAIRKKDMNSDIVKHILNTQHTMDFTKTETLTKETVWKRRTIKESLLTHESNGKAMNEVKHMLQVFG